MSKVVGKVREVLTSIYPLSFRIKEKSLDRETMNKRLFIQILTQLKDIEDKSNFLIGEIGVDLTMYEDNFYSVIENLMKMCFSKQQIIFIQLYLNDLSLDPDWDGTITVTEGTKEKIVNFETPADVWNVITKYSQE